MEKLQIFRTNIWYEGTYLNEIKIKTEEYTDFDRTFSQLRYYLEDEYEIVDHCNNPFNKVEKFTYWFNDEDGFKVYVERCAKKDANGSYVYTEGEDRKAIYDGINIGINMRTPHLNTTNDLMYTLLKYVKLYESIVKQFKIRYEIEEE